MPNANFNGTRSLMTTAAHYQHFTTDFPPKTLSITIDIVSGNPSDFVCKLIKEATVNSSCTYTIQDLSLSTNRATVQITGFGSNFAKSITIVPMNTQFGAPYTSYIDYTMAATLS